MTRLLTAAAALALLSAPALAQTGTTGATTTPPVMPQTQTDSVNGSTGANANDNMGAAARTGDINAPAGGAMATDGMSTSSTTAGSTSATPTEGLDPATGAAGSSDTPSGGIVPGQSPE